MSAEGEEARWWMYTYRTRPCIAALRGRCALGAECVFAHGPEQVRRVPLRDMRTRMLSWNYVSAPCVYSSITECPLRYACRFAHAAQEEHLYHPMRYKTQQCGKGNEKDHGSKLHYLRCPDAHSDHERRDPEREAHLLPGITQPRAPDAKMYMDWFRTHSCLVTATPHDPNTCFWTHPGAVPRRRASPCIDGRWNYIPVQCSILRAHNAATCLYAHSRVPTSLSPPTLCSLCERTWPDGNRLSPEPLQDRTLYEYRLPESTLLQCAQRRRAAQAESRCCGQRPVCMGDVLEHCECRLAFQMQLVASPFVARLTLTRMCFCRAPSAIDDCPLVGQMKRGRRRRGCRNDPTNVCAACEKILDANSVSVFWLTREISILDYVEQSGALPMLMRTRNLVVGQQEINHIVRAGARPACDVDLYVADHIIPGRTHELIGSVLA